MARIGKRTGRSGSGPAPGRTHRAGSTTDRDRTLKALAHAGTCMDVSGDELAGIVDLFGALTRAELCDALAELAFKAGEDHDPEAFEPEVDEALRTYHLVSLEADGAGTDGGAADEGPGKAAAGDEAALLVPGPVAFPTLPEGATDLPHILDAPERSVDRETAGRAAETRFRADAASAVEAGQADRIAHLLDVSYELEAWAPVDLAAARARLDDASND